MKEWRKVKLGTLLKESRIISKFPDATKRIRVKLNVQGVETRPVKNDKKGATRYYVRKEGQFIFGKQNLHKGAFGIIPKELNGFESSSDIPAFDVDESCYPEWIYFYFKRNDFYLKLDFLAKGVGSKRIDNKQIFDLDILIPEKEEQLSILHKIHNVELTYSYLNLEISKQQSLFKNIQQTILVDGVQGKLTEEWREQNSGQESVFMTLNRIKAEKEFLIKSKLLKQESKLLPIDEDKFPYIIPDSWSWCRLDDVVEIKGGVTKGKKNMGKLKSTAYLRVANVQRGYIDFSEVKEIQVSDTDYKKYQLQENDLLIIEGGDRDKVGRCAIWKNQIQGCIYQNHIFRLRPFIKNDLDEQYLMFYLNSFYGQDYFKANAKQTTNLASINKTVVRNLIIPIPPKKEQSAISRLINKIELSVKKMEFENSGIVTNSKMLMNNFIEKILGQEEIPSPKRKLVESGNLDFIKKVNTNESTFMELTEILKTHKKLLALDLWRMSKFYGQKDEEQNIDDFYAELKRQIEEKHLIKESENEKGYLELV